MKVVRWTRGGGPARLGALIDDEIHEIEGGWDDLRMGEGVLPLGEITLESPITPRSIICVGLNYRAHAKESGYRIPSAPPLFTKLTSAVVRSGEAVRVPSIATEVDYEAELGVVIGRRAKDVSVSEALTCVAGYIPVNDLSARDLQNGEGFGWVRGKSADGFCPVGPWVVTADEVPDPQTLRLRCSVNGRLRQDSTTADMIFSVAQIISYISQAVTLSPGDLVCTGTPGGVGAGMHPPRYLEPGDVVRVEIDRLGAVENTIERNSNR